MPPENEIRSFKVAELRTVKVDGKKMPMITGKPAIFNSLSQNLGGFYEKVRKGCFSRTLSEKSDIRALIEHDPKRIIGRSTSGTLRLAEDDNGLNIEIDPPDTQYARDIIECIDRGDVSGMSFGFRCRVDDWHVEDGQTVRELIDVDLFDVTVTAFPAYLATDVALRSLDNYKKQHELVPVEILKEKLELELTSI